MRARGLALGLALGLAQASALQPRLACGYDPPDTLEQVRVLSPWQQTQLRAR